ARGTRSTYGAVPVAGIAVDLDGDVRLVAYGALNALVPEVVHLGMRVEGPIEDGLPSSSRRQECGIDAYCQDECDDQRPCGGQPTLRRDEIDPDARGCHPRRETTRTGVSDPSGPELECSARVGEPMVCDVYQCDSDPGDEDGALVGKPCSDETEHVEDHDGERHHSDEENPNESGQCHIAGTRKEALEIRGRKIEVGSIDFGLRGHDENQTEDSHQLHDADDKAGLRDSPAVQRNGMHEIDSHGTIDEDGEEIECESKGMKAVHADILGAPHSRE